MTVSAATERALEYIAQRSADVAHAFTAGAQPRFDDVATPAAAARPVLDPLCVASPADALFVTSDERGRTVYTQDGSFSLHDGVLVGENGRPILGFRSPGAPLSELRIDAIDTMLGRTAAARIEADGSLTYERATIDPRSGARSAQRVVVGRVALARFPAATRLAAVDANHGTAPQGVLAHVGCAGDGNFASISPMCREESRIDFDRSLERLKDAYVAFDALLAAHKARGSLGKTAMDLLK